MDAILLDMSYSPNIDHFDARIPPEKKSRIPPGQKKVDSFPILSINATPDFNGVDWDFTIEGLVQNPKTWTWKELLALPKTTITADFHCVTGWSRLDLEWTGVSLRTVSQLVQPFPQAHYVTSYGPEQYTSSLPFLDYMDDEDVLLAYELNGEPLDPEHGGPLRLIIPKIYAYKSTKWLQKLVFTEKWERGFWEKLGYHQRADPWLEERFSRQEKTVKKIRLEIEKEFKKKKRNTI